VTGSVRVGDTQFALPGLHGHRGKVISGHLQVGQEVETEVDHIRRERIRKNHTGTHLLHWALREVVGDHAHQAGSHVAPDRLRFDFSHYAALDGEQVLEVERQVNERVIENAMVATLETSKEDAEEMGALAFFGDKYGDRVRVVKAGDYSTEFCGGTHVPSTGQIGPLIVVSEGSVAANTRRIEALTGVAAFEHLIGLRQELESVAGTLRTQPPQLMQAAEGLMVRLNDQEERIERYEAQARSDIAADLFEGLETHGEHGILIGAVDGFGGDELRALAHQLRERMGSGIGVLGSSLDGKGVLIGFVSADLVETGVSAGTIIEPAAEILGGGGSRDPQLAQAGGPRGEEIGDALEAAAAVARVALAGL